MQNTQVHPKAAVFWPVAEGAHRSDLSLLNAIATGDRQAMQILYARYSVKVHRFVVRMIRDPSQAEDVLSEVFFEVWQQAGRFSRRSQVPTWILAIARLKAISIGGERIDETLDKETVEAIADEAEGPHAILEKRDTGNLLRQCIQRLPQIHREILDLVYYHELSLAEAAEVVGVPQNTVKTRLFNARKKMLALLREANALH